MDKIKRLSKGYNINDSKHNSLSDAITFMEMIDRIETREKRCKSCKHVKVINDVLWLAECTKESYEDEAIEGIEICPIEK